MTLSLFFIAVLPFLLLTLLFMATFSINIASGLANLIKGKLIWGMGTKLKSSWTCQLRLLISGILQVTKAAQIPLYVKPLLLLYTSYNISYLFLTTMTPQEGSIRHWDGETATDKNAVHTYNAASLSICWNSQTLLQSRYIHFIL